MKKLGKYLFFGGIIFAVLPLISLLIAGTTATMAGCELNESAIHPCVLGGIDWGELLGLMAMSGWFVFFTVPIGGLVAILGLIISVVRWVLRKSQKDASGIAK